MSGCAEEGKAVEVFCLFCFVVLFYCFTVNLAKTLASFPVLYSYLWLRYGLDKAMIRQLIELVGLPDSQGG